MLSRMNLTLSALALSNGLNLGTRSLAANADVNLDGQTLYILTPIMTSCVREWCGIPFRIPNRNRDSSHSQLNFPGSDPATELRDMPQRGGWRGRCLRRDRAEAGRPRRHDANRD